MYTLPSCPAASAKSLFQSTMGDDPSGCDAAAVAMETSSRRSSSRCLSSPNDVQCWLTSFNVNSPEGRELSCVN